MLFIREHLILFLEALIGSTWRHQLNIFVFSRENARGTAANKHGISVCIDDILCTCQRKDFAFLQNHFYCNFLGPLHTNSTLVCPDMTGWNRKYPVVFWLTQFRIELAKTQQYISVSSNHIRTNWCGIRMQWTEKITVKMVLEKSKVFSLGKCIKCHLHKQKYHVVCRSSSSFLHRKYEYVELVSSCGTNYYIQAKNKMFPDKNIQNKYGW